MLGIGITGWRYLVADSNPWERTWNDVVVQPVEKAVEAVKSSLPWERTWNDKETASTPPPVAPKPIADNGIDNVFSKLVKTESGGVHMDAKGNLTTSPVGAEGITQLMPSTAKKPGFGIEPVKDKSEGEYLRVGKEYLGALYKKFGGDAEKALAAYNAGLGNVQKAIGKAERFGGDWKDHLPKKEETLPYIQKILGRGNA